MNKIVFPFDSIGLIPSTLWTTTCMATPFLFVAKACADTCCSEAPSWWLMIDYLFLIISFLAIFFISRSLTIQWLKTAFWISWIVLLLTIANHSLSIILLPKNFIYFPSIAIIILHFYNLQFCKCQNETCCS